MSNGYGNTTESIIAEKAKLEAKRDALEAQCAALSRALEAPGISEARELALRNHCVAIANNFSDITKEITALDARLPDARTWRKRTRDWLMVKTSDIIFFLAASTCASIGMWFAMRNFAMLRYRSGAYTEQQAKWRRVLFQLHRPDVFGAARIGLGAGVVSVVRLWTMPMPSAYRRTATVVNRG
jgi:hypothetical protein